MIVLGYLSAIQYDYRIYQDGECPDSWRNWADTCYNPRHLPTIPLPADLPHPTDKTQYRMV